MSAKRKGKYVPGDFELVVRRSKTGLGLFTERAIPKGVCIIEYKGKIITQEEEYTSNSKYLFEIHSRKTIDGKPKWNKAGYINHSCRPNAEPKVRNHRVFIMARRAIKAGEEIVYDYGKEYFNDHIKPYGCRCERCRPAYKITSQKRRARTMR
ncbi:SET domain-containing protein [Candidatus Parcubacteria bacterium]|nr:SET domain-containing protein [Candidatus Parcubacteria bacterium]